MNISSIIVKTNKESILQVVDIIKSIDYCEYHMDDGETKIIVTIEGENIDEEVKKFNELKTIEGVLSTEVVYAYSSEELEQERSKLEASDSLPKWLNSDVDAKDIVYKGDLRRKNRR